MRITKSKLKEMIQEAIAEAAKPDYLDLDKDGDKEESMKAAAADADDDDKEPVDENAFAPNHYCIHHGGVQMEGELKLGKVIGHNWSTRLQKVTKYDMELEDGTILENVKAEDILATEASLANEHAGHPAKRDDEEE
tara:strand:+ start:166 stop:576 length:411 start_codon:yes stop_codon:yes gene_type:complete